MMGHSEGGDRFNLATRFASARLLALVAVSFTALSQPALSQVKGGGAIGPPAMGQIGPAGPAMAPQAPIFTPSIPVFSPGVGVPQLIPSETGASKGGAATANRTTSLSNQKQIALGFQVAPTADGPWPVPGVGGQFSGGGNLRLLSSNADGVLKLDIKGPGTYNVTLSSQQLNKAVTAVGNTDAGPPGIIAVLIGLLLPAIQKQGVEVLPWSWSQHAYLNYGTNAGKRGDLTVTVIVPEGDGLPTIDWGDGTPAEIGVNVAAGDVNGDGFGEARVAVVRNPEPSQLSRSDCCRLEFEVGRAAKFTSGVGVTSTVGGNVRQLTTNDQGAVLLGKLPAGTFDLNISGENLKSWLNTAVGPTNPEHPETWIELLVVIAIIAMKADGEPVIVGRTLPAISLPQTLPLKLTVSGDGTTSGTWWDGIPLVALSPDATGGSVKTAGTATGGARRSESSDFLKPPAPAPAFAGSQPISNDDASRLKIELTDITITKLKAGEVGVVTGVFKPEQATSQPTDSKGALLKDNNDPRIGR